MQGQAAGLPEEGIFFSFFPRVRLGNSLWAVLMFAQAWVYNKKETIKSSKAQVGQHQTKPKKYPNVFVTMVSKFYFILCFMQIVEWNMQTR